VTPLVDIDDSPCPRCDGTVADHLGGRSAACIYCGQRVTLCREPEPAPPAPGEHRLESGRFAGLTLAEALAEPNGRRYLEHQARSDAALAARISSLDGGLTTRHVVRSSEAATAAW
jgi:hypothetical protein